MDHEDYQREIQKCLDEDLQWIPEPKTPNAKILDLTERLYSETHINIVLRAFGIPEPIHNQDRAKAIAETIKLLRMHRSNVIATYMLDVASGATPALKIVQEGQVTTITTEPKNAPPGWKADGCNFGCCAFPAKCFPRGVCVMNLGAA